MSVSERIGITITIFIAAVFAYATFPAFQLLLMPGADPLWEPLVSTQVTVGIITGVIVLGVLRALVGHVKTARVSGSPLIPTVVWAVGFAVIASLASLLIAYWSFNVTAEVLMSLGIESSVAFVIGVLVAIVVLKIL
ncbi:hypothetical protein [Marinobacter sp. ELB17]|uniref:hypothetical protein n=1 Tax=Marinobacter sp. ELB17 TaxID=270374 RepID=UPI0000F381FE|nr:hypothetical protein [Marinobacter sp. ELB17]EAZ98138.1 hypothetical protein MELB17_09648 [Marinobacter sp. ELB17]